jgi:hypothetical protein
MEPEEVARLVVMLAKDKAGTGAGAGVGVKPA